MPLTSTIVPVRVGGGGGNRTPVQGFAGPCLNHSATPPGEGATVDDPSLNPDSPPVQYGLHRGWGYAHLVAHIPGQRRESGAPLTPETHWNNRRGFRWFIGLENQVRVTSHLA